VKSCVVSPSTVTLWLTEPKQPPAVTVTVYVPLGTPVIE
jgi:hypothetical protein